MKKITFITAGVALAAMPLFASAANTIDPSWVYSVLNTFKSVLNMLIPMLIAASLVAFFYGLFGYIHAGGGGGKEGSKNIMISGLIALFVMVSVWGIISLAQQTIGVDSNNSSITIPTVPQNN